MKKVHQCVLFICSYIPLLVLIFIVDLSIDAACEAILLSHKP